MDERKNSVSKDDLAREMFLNFPARMKNLTIEERNALDSFLSSGKTDRFLALGCKTIIMDPVLFLRVRRAVEKYGDVVIDVMNDLLCGFPEDGINADELPRELILKELFKDKEGI